MLEKSLLGRAGTDRLFSLSSVDDVKRLLLEHGYPQQDSAEAMVREARGELYHLFSDIAPDDRYWQLLLMDDDALNLKVALKTMLAEEEPDEATFSAKLSSPSLISHELLWRHSVAADKDAPLPTWAKTVMTRAKEAYLRHYDMASVDRSIDHDIAWLKMKMVAPLGESWLKDYLSMTRDLVNLETLLRAKYRDIAISVFEESLLPDGLVDKETWLHCYLEEPSFCIDRLCGSPYMSLSSHFASYKEPGGAQAFSRDRDNLLYDKLERGMHMLSGAYRVMAYVMARESEYKNIRIALSMLQDGLDETSLSSLRRDFQKR